MAGLLYKDWLLARRQLWYYLLLLGIYVVLVSLGALDASFLCGLAVLYGTVLPILTFGYDELARWEGYAAATPAGQTGVADGKYLFSLLVILLSGGGALLLTVLMEGGARAPVSAVLACTGLALAENAILLPFLLMLGATRSRAALYIIYLLFFGGGVILLLLVRRGVLPLPALPPETWAALPWLMAGLCALLYAASWGLARRLYRSKAL